jgi:hypothetical protein
VAGIAFADQLAGVLDLLQMLVCRFPVKLHAAVETRICVWLLARRTGDALRLPERSRSLEPGVLRSEV